MRKLFREYRVEILAGFVIVLGVFLLIEPFELRASLRAALASLANYWQTEGSGILFNLTASIRNFLTTRSLSDLVGAGLVALAILFMIWRIRRRFVTLERFLPVTCPRCGSTVERIHRSTLDRIVGKIFLPHSRRYGCVSESCTWSGLRVHGHRHAQQSGIRPTQ